MPNISLGKRPLPATTGTDYISMSAGSDFSAAARKDSTLWTWGSNGSEQPGRGTYGGFRNRPEMAGSGDISTGSGSDNSFMIRSDGTMGACGCNDEGQPGLGE